MLADNAIDAVTKETPLRVLIVESERTLAKLWQKHLERDGMVVSCVQTQKAAIDLLEVHPVDIIILDLVLEEGAALAISDVASYHQPKAQVIFVTNSTFFSDGSIFAHSANARAFVPSTTPPEDLAAMAQHYATRQR